jgi:hypothetical protein
MTTMSDLIDRVVEAMKATEFDCAGWQPDCLRELARVAIEAVRADEPVVHRPQPSADKLNGAFKRATTW